MEALSADEMMEMGYLYRRASGDLSVARRDFPQEGVALYLNQLVARAHAVVYRPEAGEWRGITGFFREGFPSLFREMLPFTIAAFCIFAVAALAGFLAVLIFPDTASYLVPGNVAESVRQQRMWTEGTQLPPELMASAIMTNNIRVAIMALAGGILFGVFTFYVMMSNGLSFGVIAGFCQAHGFSLPLWSFVSAHGVIELTVVFMAGGAGLRLGYALLHPGLQSRRESLVLAARNCMRLIFGCVPLLVVAGVIEGFISPSALLSEAKISIGLITGVILYGYLLRAGRRGTGAKA